MKSMFRILYIGIDLIRGHIPNVFPLLLSFQLLIMFYDHIRNFFRISKFAHNLFHCFAACQLFLNIILINMHLIRNLLITQPAFQLQFQNV